MFTHEGRRALASLRRSPRFSLTAVATLAAALGAAGGLAGILNALVLRPLPVRGAERLVAISPWFTSEMPAAIPGDTFEALAARQEVFEDIAGYLPGAFPVEHAGRVSMRPAEFVTAAHYRLLGVEPFIGRLIDETDTPRVGAGQPVAVISHSYWLNALGGDPTAVGRPLIVEGLPVTVIGVTPPGFAGLNLDRAPDITVPLAFLSRARGGGGVTAVRAIGRLRPGVALEQARAQVELLWPEVWKATNPPRGSRPALRLPVVRVTPLGGGFSGLRDRYARALNVLVGLAVLLLALSCVNVGGLFLARARDRAGDTRIQAALGATPARLAVQAASEGLWVAGAAALLALPLAAWIGAALVRTMWTGTLPTTLQPGPDARVIALIAAAAFCAGLAVSAPPMLLARVHARGPVSGGARARMPIAWRRAAIAGQIAVSLTLLSSAALFTRHLLEIRRLDPGYDASRLLWGRVVAVPGTTRQDERADLLGVIERASAVPGVASAALSLGFPVTQTFQVASLPPVSRVGSDEPGEASANSEPITPGFFGTAGIALVRGRDFTWQDSAGQPEVAIVNLALAARLFGAEDPIGQRIRTSDGRVHTIVGLARNASPGDVRLAELPTVYRPVLQFSRTRRGGVMVVRTAGAAPPEEALGDAVAADGRHFLEFVRTVDDRLDQMLLRERVLSALSSAFALLGLVIGALGLHAVLAYTVARRRPEFALRLALGAGRGRLLRLVLAEGLVLAATGAAVGIPLALGAGRAAQSFVDALRPFDPLAFAGALALLVAAAAAASLIPAARAARVEPAAELRHRT